jgi:DNA polymerase IIIc chi subunit
VSGMYVCINGDFREVAQAMDSKTWQVEALAFLAMEVERQTQIVNPILKQRMSVAHFHCPYPRSNFL